MHPDEYQWEIPDNIDITNFNFAWRPLEYEPAFIHQFGTQWQKTGGPKLIHNDATQTKYETHMRVRALPNNNWTIDPKFSGTMQFDFSWHPDASDPPMSYVFGNQYKSAEGSRFITYGNHRRVKYMQHTAFIEYTPLDIVFLSNGETGEQHRYDRLCEASKRKVEWVKGIQGRENAIRHAAELSNTEWFILFPGKLYADEKFNFNFQPDRYIDPVHYIFYATNPLNGLIYGHQAAVCYNKKLVLETEKTELDFTLSKPHEVVPIISGMAQYNCDAFITWRTAFREVIKLNCNTDEMSKKRLDTWMNVANGEYSEYSLMGANDGMEYFNEVNGDYQELMKTYEWEWLSDYFENKYLNI